MINQGIGRGNFDFLYRTWTIIKSKTEAIVIRVKAKKIGGTELREAFVTV